MEPMKRSQPIHELNLAYNYKSLARCFLILYQSIHRIFLSSSVVKEVRNCVDHVTSADDLYGASTMYYFQFAIQGMLDVCTTRSLSFIESCPLDLVTGY